MRTGQGKLVVSRFPNQAQHSFPHRPGPRAILSPRRKPATQLMARITLPSLYFLAQLKQTAGFTTKEDLISFLPQIKVGRAPHLTLPRAPPMVSVVICLTHMHESLMLKGQLPAAYGCKLTTLAVGYFP